MTDTPGGTSPFGSFPGMTGFPQGDMMEKMWDMMKLNPFAAAAAPGGSPSLSMMSDMLAPLTNVEELDKRIKDMRAVEQWLKLNLNMLQSAIQALEVQRATLATLRAFGAFAQSSVEKASSSAPSAASGWPAPPGKEPKAEPETETPNEAGVSDASFDPSGWWNMLQSQFNSLATLAMAQQHAGAATPSMSTDEDENGDDDGDDEIEPSEATAPPEADAPPAARKAAAKKTPARKAAPRKKPL
ncbi:alginate biosynthesis protein AlgP [Caballeronia sp. LjRoot34]|uniref:PhaM family polyhydroxyalkanoate granule multifunctional regulatory protein n=1 Tax=Caballeronia sp. LjRoot34 TaxID=3342325 RepID=UPI003ED02440